MKDLLDTLPINQELTIDESNMNRIMDIVYEQTGICTRLLTSKTRKREIAIARHTAMYFIKLNNPEITLKKIGKHFGNRDHSTVIHGLITVADLCDSNKKYKENMMKICNIINPVNLDRVGRQLVQSVDNK
jgi:chromosomal replication initiator protein